MPKAGVASGCFRDPAMLSPVKSYVICTTQRSGSYLLSVGLGDTGVAGYPTERFPPSSQQSPVGLDQIEWITQPAAGVRYDAREDAEYVQQVIELGTSPNGVFGVKIHWFQFEDALRRLRAYTGRQGAAPAQILAAAFPNLAYIWLRRRDTVAQAVSWYRAIHSQQFVRYRDGSGGGAQDMPEPEFDFNKIRAFISTFRCSDNAWQKFFADHSIRPCIVTYEDFVCSYRSTMRSVLKFLAIEDSNVVIGEPRLEKMSGHASEDWARRYHEIAGRRNKRGALLSG
jgi:LPS sulfotransferase NodH